MEGKDYVKEGQENKKFAEQGREFKSRRRTRRREKVEIFFVVTLMSTIYHVTWAGGDHHVMSGGGRNDTMVTSSYTSSYDDEGGWCPDECECVRLHHIVHRHPSMTSCPGLDNSSLVVICHVTDPACYQDDDVTSRNSSAWWPPLLPNHTRALVLDGSSLCKLGRVSNPRPHREVVYLSVRASHVSEIETRVVQRLLPQLRCVSLGENVISSRKWASTLLPNRHLNQLDLSANHIHRLNETSFTAYTQLKRLNLAYNYVVTIKPFTFEDLSQLEYLDLTGNALSVAGLQTASLFGLQSLTHLHMGENQIFETVPQVAGKGLYSTKLAVFDLHGLTRLQKITAAAFKDLPWLRELNLSDCGINELELGWLDSYTHRHLQVLDMSRSRLRHLQPHSLAGFHEKLDLVLTPLPALQWLSLSGSRHLASLDGSAFNFVPALKFLFLQRCNISRMNVAANDPLNPNKINLHNTLPLLQAIWIFGNPLTCNCHVRALLHASLPSCHVTGSCDQSQQLRIDPPTYEREGDVYVVTSSRSCCYDGGMHARVELDEARLDGLVCETDKMTVLVSIVLGPLAFAAAILVAFLCGFTRTLLRRIRTYKSSTSSYHKMIMLRHAADVITTTATSSANNSHSTAFDNKSNNLHRQLRHHDDGKSLMTSSAANPLLPSTRHQSTHDDVTQDGDVTPPSTPSPKPRFRHGTNVVMNKLKTTSLSVPQHHAYEMTRFTDHDHERAAAYDHIAARP